MRLTLTSRRRISPTPWVITGVVRDPDFEIGEVYECYHPIEDEGSSWRKLVLRVLTLEGDSCSVRVIWHGTVERDELPDDLVHTTRAMH